MTNIPVLPTITSITASDPTTTSSGTVHYTITFSEPVTGVTADQFSVATTGTLAGAGVTGVTPVAGSNGASYVVTVNSGYGDGTLALQLTGGNVRDGNGYALGPFKSANEFSGSGGSLLGDVNGDGRPDMLTYKYVSSAHGTISVMLNDGSSTLFAPAITTDIATSTVTTLALGDLNGDGKLDLIYGRYDDGKLGVRLGNGDGTFGADSTYAIGLYSGAYPSQITVTDLNHDGRADVVVANQVGRSVSVLLGNGDGTLQSQTVYAAGDPPSSPNDYMTIGDFNGDGNSDLVVLGASGISMMLGNGDGTFGARTTFGAGGASDIVSADFNGDGKLDLAIVRFQNVQVLLGNGNGSFAAATSTALPDYGSGLTVSDINGDGKLDLLTSGSTGPQILYGMGDGIFRAPVTVPGPGGSYHILVADLNGDGKPDLYASRPGYNTTVMLGSTSNAGAPAYTIHRPIPALAITDTAVTLGTDGTYYINAAHYNGGATTLSGVATAGDIITVTNPVDQTVVGTATAGVDGSWSLNVSGLQDGHTYSYVASTTDGTGNPVAGPTLTFTVDKTPPALTIDIEPVDSTGKFNVIGTIGQADSGSALTINQAGWAALGSTNANADGSWVLANQTLAVGLSYRSTLSVQATDAAGNTASSASMNLRITSDESVSTNSATKYLVRPGSQFSSGLNIYSGGTVTGARLAPGATMTVYVGGKSVDAKLWSGAIERVYGTSQGSVILNGGGQYVYGAATGATVQSGGFQGVYAGGTATDTMLYGAGQVQSGGTAVHTSIMAYAQQYVASGGTSRNNVVNASGLLYVAVGGSDSNSTVNSGGIVYLYGTSTGMTLNQGGMQFDYGTSNGATVMNGAIQHVINGSANGTIVAAGGYQDVYNGTLSNTVLSGYQQVIGSGVATATTIEAGGNQFVASGGSTSGTVVKTGGRQYVDAGGADSGNAVNGGYQYVAGTATSTTVSGGGEQDVGAGGVATGTHLVDGTEYVFNGGLAQGIDFGGAAAATLILDNPDGLAGSIANWGAGDRIDFRNTTIASFDIDSSNHLTVTTSGGASYSWDLLAQYSASSFVLQGDGLGGTVLSYEPPAQMQLAVSH